jgi:hypothetical protein
MFNEFPYGNKEKKKNQTKESSLEKSLEKSIDKSNLNLLPHVYYGYLLINLIGKKINKLKD